MRYFADYIKGKPYQKTVLWENSSPTSDFGDVTVELSETMNNYDQLMFVYQTTKTSNDPISVIMSVSDFKKTNWGTNVGDYRLFIGGMPVSNTNESRMAARVDDTHIRFYYAYTYAGASNSTYLIPLKIIGIKKGLGETAPKVKTGFLASLPSNGFIDCGFDPKHVMFVGAYNTNYALCCVYDEDISTTTYRRYYANTSAEQNKELTIGDTTYAGFLSIGNGTNGFSMSYASNFANVRYIATE